MNERLKLKCPYCEEDRTKVDMSDDLGVDCATNMVFVCMPCKIFYYFDRDINGDNYDNDKPIYKTKIQDSIQSFYGLKLVIEPISFIDVNNAVKNKQEKKD